MASRLAPATPNKVAVKKIQGQLKNSVSTYGTLVLGWQSDVCEVVKLVQYYKGLVVKSESIQKAIDERAHFITSIPENDFVGRQLLSSVRLDMEGTLVQMKTFEKRLKDTMVAMIVTYEDAMKSISNEVTAFHPQRSFELFEPGAVFTADHVLDMQQLHRGFALELERKLNLTKCIFASSKVADSDVRISNVSTQHPSFAATVVEINKVLQGYDDTSAASHIDHELVNIYLLKNNILPE